MSVDGVRRVIVAGVPLIEVVDRRGIHPPLILTRHDIVARIGSQLHHPTRLRLSGQVTRPHLHKPQERLLLTRIVPLIHAPCAVEVARGPGRTAGGCG
jgi:hypothetical protein